MRRRRYDALSMAFDLLLRGGTLVDGTGAPGRPADVARDGRPDRRDRGPGARSTDADVARVIDATGHVVAPGFVDPHGHSDGSLFLDGALASHLRQGYTTQLSGNCGYTFAPLTPPARAMLDRRPRGPGAGPALDDVRRVPRRGRRAGARDQRRVPGRARDGPRRRARVLGPRARRRRARGDGPRTSTRRSTRARPGSRAG